MQSYPVRLRLCIHNLWYQQTLAMKTIPDPSPTIYKNRSMNASICTWRKQNIDTPTPTLMKEESPCISVHPSIFITTSGRERQLASLLCHETWISFMSVWCYHNALQNATMQQYFEIPRRRCILFTFLDCIRNRRLHIRFVLALLRGKWLVLWSHGLPWTKSCRVALRRQFFIMRRHPADISLGTGFHGETIVLLVIYRLHGLGKRRRVSGAARTLARRCWRCRSWWTAWARRTVKPIHFP
jgi:hypothetical protein